MFEEKSTPKEPLSPDDAPVLVVMNPQGSPCYLRWVSVQAMTVKSYKAAGYERYGYLMARSLKEFLPYVNDSASPLTLVSFNASELATSELAKQVAALPCLYHQEVKNPMHAGRVAILKVFASKRNPDWIIKEPKYCTNSAS